MRFNLRWYRHRCRSLVNHKAELLLKKVTIICILILLISNVYSVLQYFFQRCKGPRLSAQSGPVDIKDVLFLVEKHKFLTYTYNRTPVAASYWLKPHTARNPNSTSVPASKTPPRNQGLPEKLPQSTTCKDVHYPSNKNLKMSNLYWQVLTKKNWEIYFYSAFYDNRRLKDGKGVHIRVLAVVNSANVENQTFFCQYWFTHAQKPDFAKASLKFLWPWKKEVHWNRRQKTVAFSIMITCPLNEDKNSIPNEVSVVTKKCYQPGNRLHVTHNPPPQSLPAGIGVCVKALDFPERDISYKLVEWVELLRVLGAIKIQMYLLSVPPNTKKVLDYYVRKGYIDLRNFTLPGKLPNEPINRHRLLTKNLLLKRHLELLPYNDCLYRNGIYGYKYLTLLDVDEVILPRKTKTWHDLLAAERDLNTTLFDSYTTFQVKQGGCFFDGVKQPLHSGIPETMHMLQHIYKIPAPPTQRFGTGTKMFFVPQKVLYAFNHFPAECLTGKCRKGRLHMNEITVQLQHYKHIRRHCNGPKRASDNYHCDHLECMNNTVIDRSLWRYNPILIPRFEAAVKSIFKDHPPRVDGANGKA